jgi:hypothetical protein
MNCIKITNVTKNRMRLFLQSAVMGLSVLSCNNSLNASWRPQNPNYIKYSSNEAALRAGVAKSDPDALYTIGTQCATF